MTVDDEFLSIYSNTGILDYYFADKYYQTNAIWPIILEKAWAKVIGAYTDVKHTHPADALRALTGAPVFFNSTFADAATLANELDANL